MSDEAASSIRVELAPRSAAPGNALWREVVESFRNPEFWAFSSWLDLIARARKSRFGMAWLLMPSVVYVFGLGSVFAQMQGSTISQFAAHVALGALVFRILMSTFIGSANVLSASQSFILDGHMRLTDYLLQSMAKATFDMVMYLPVTILALVMFGHPSLHGLAYAPLTLALIYVNGLWVSVVFALLGARFSDFGQLLGNVSMFLFLLTPIIWYAEQMPAGGIRARMMQFNPFYHFVTLFRAPILGEPVSMFTIYYIATMTIFGLVLATFVYRRYARYVPLWI